MCVCWWGGGQEAGHMKGMEVREYNTFREQQVKD